MFRWQRWGTTITIETNFLYIEKMDRSAISFDRGDFAVMFSLLTPGNLQLILFLLSALTALELFVVIGCSHIEGF